MVLTMERWIGKVAVVTGASAGIGATIAEKLVNEGVIVVGLARRKERIEENAKKLENKRGKLIAVRADISIEQDILNAFEWITANVGTVHILINNAGIAQQTTLTSGVTEKWRKVFEVNVLGLCIATREAVKIMRKNNIDGHIVHINSIAGHKVLLALDANVYSASKYAVTALTETLRRELTVCGTKIKVTSVSPGYVKTEISQTNNFVIDPARMKVRLSGPILNTDDVANAVLYTLSTPPHVQVHEITIKPVNEII